MEYNELVDWLFEGSKMVAQVGMAGADKKAYFWLPGKKDPNYVWIQRKWKTAELRGCTQLAYEKAFSPMAGQRCEICWVGLDVDAEDNPDVDIIGHVYPQASMVRTSGSGLGVHVIYRLAEPVACTNETANVIIKHITAPLVADLAHAGIKVCKSDRRMYWMIGGKNRIISQFECRLLPDIEPQVLRNIAAPVIGRGDISPCPSVVQWAADLGLPACKKSTPIYVGDIVNRLRARGERVTTKSGCRGNGGINGYLDIDDYSISLFAYADGHVIWNYTDVEALTGGENQ